LSCCSNQLRALIDGCSFLLLAYQQKINQQSNLTASNFGHQQYFGFEYTNWNSLGTAWTGAFAQWNVPTASAPSGMCQFAHCDFDIWVGEANQAGGANGIAQAGSGSGVLLCRRLLGGFTIHGIISTTLIPYYRYELSAN
jgi:hypothetical protein